MCARRRLAGIAQAEPIRPLRLRQPRIEDTRLHGTIPVDQEEAGAARDRADRGNWRTGRRLAGIAQAEPIRPIRLPQPWIEETELHGTIPVDQEETGAARDRADRSNRRT